MRHFIFCAALAAAFPLSAAAQQAPRTFSVSAADGTQIHGQADLPDGRVRTAVIFVAGTGPFDRDGNFGASGTPRDLVFVDLAQRLNARGLAAVRYDRRGVNHGGTGPDRITETVAGTTTNETQRDELGAIYTWTRARDGLRARCVIFFGHSEGMAHIGRLAASGAPAPRGVIGVGALLESPRSVFHWQRTGRDAYSLRMMDTDGDGRTTNEEVRANYMRTPSGVWETIAPFLAPDGAWEAAELESMPAIQEAAIYAPERDYMLSQPDEAPFPNAETALGSFAWIKSFFLDETPIAQHLAHWDAPMIFHYGSYDSQTVAERQQAAAAPIASRATFITHQDRGHTLGEHPLRGPMDEALAERIADEAAEMARGCR